MFRSGTGADHHPLVGPFVQCRWHPACRLLAATPEHGSSQARQGTLCWPTSIASQASSERLSCAHLTLLLLLLDGPECIQLELAAMYPILHGWHPSAGCCLLGAGCRFSRDWHQQSRVHGAGWSYRKNGLEVRRQGPVTIYGVPYSEHSSFPELRDCVKLLRPKRLVPTVNAGNPTASRRVADRFAGEACHITSILSYSSARPPQTLVRPSCFAFHL